MAAVVELLALLPVPSVAFVEGRIAHANTAACDLLECTPDQLGPGFRPGLYEDADRTRLDDLLSGVVDVATLRWGEAPPVTSLLAHARSLDATTMLIVLVDESETARLDGILTAVNNAALLADRDRRAVWFSRGMREAYGIPYPLGSDTLDRVHPDDHRAMQKAFDEALATPRRKLRETARVTHQDFPDVWWQLDMLSMNLLDDPAVGGVVTMFGPHVSQGDDVDDTPDVMRMSDIMPVGIIQTLGDGTCYYRNRLAVQQLGPVELGDLPEVWIERARVEDQEALWRAAKEATAGHRSEPVVACFDTSGVRSWFRIELSPQFTTHGRPTGWVATSLDVTAEIDARDELHQAQERLWHLANHDALTGLPNRPAIIDRIDNALARNRRESHGVALLFCDLDGFKPVNDAHGHEAGDEVLRAVAVRLGLAVRETDVVGRLGGDEFVVLCENFDADSEVRAVEERITDSLTETISVGVPARDVSVGVTIGSVIAEPDDSSATLLARADASMYENKKR